MSVKAVMKIFFLSVLNLILCAFAFVPPKQTPVLLELILVHNSSEREMLKWSFC